MLLLRPHPEVAMIPRRNLALSLVVLLSLTAAPRLSTAETWRQESFLVGGFGLASSDSLSFRAQLAKLDSLGFDWVADGGYAPRAASIAASADSLLQSVPATKIRVLPSYGARFGLYLRDTPCCTSNFVCNFGGFWDSSYCGPGGYTHCRFDVATYPGQISTNGAAEQSAEQALIAAKLAPDPSLQYRTNYPSTLGWYVWDEPDSLESFADIGTTTTLVEALDGEKLAFVNLYPIQVWDAETGACNQYRESFGSSDAISAYETYLRSYLDLFIGKGHPAPVLSADHYPFEDDLHVGDKYMINLKLLDRWARRYSRHDRRVPWWMVVQLSNRVNVGSPNDTMSTPTFVQTRWQVFTALAYGARGISYWTLAPTGNATTKYTNGLLLGSGQANPAKVDSIRSLNRYLHGLGPTLMQLDHVVTYHKSTGGQQGIDEDVLGSASQIYNIVTDVTGAGSADAMVGYFKHETTGDDYLLVVNKSLTTTRSFTVKLANLVEQVARIDRLSGAAVTVTSGGSQFTASNIVPGGGELYRIRDGIDEYIPNVNAIRIRKDPARGDLTYYAHDKGVVMVRRATGAREYHKDGTVFTPVVDLIVAENANPAADTVYVCQRAGAAGNVIRLTAGLAGFAGSLGTWYGDAQTGGTSITVSPERVFIGVSVGSDSGGVVTMDRGATTSSFHPFHEVVNDVSWSTARSGSVVMAHGKGMAWMDDASPWSILANWQDGTATTPVQSVVATPTHVYMGLDGGTGGHLSRVEAADPSQWIYWTDNGAYPRVSGLSLTPEGDSVAAVTRKGSSERIGKFNASNLAVSSMQLLSGLRTTCFVSRDTLLVATTKGVKRIVASDDLPIEELAVEQPISAHLSGKVAMEFASPVRTDARIVLFAGSSGHATLDLFDVRGRRVRELYSGPATDRVEVRWSAAGLAGGVYFYSLRQGADQVRGKLVVLR